MDPFKKATVKDYTAWDLNCPRYVKHKHGRDLKIKFKRKARRKQKQDMRDCKLTEMQSD